MSIRVKYTVYQEHLHVNMLRLCTTIIFSINTPLRRRPAIDNPAVPPNLSGPTRLQVAHLDHPLHESPKKLVLVLAENPNVLPRLREGIQRLVRVQEPSPRHKVLEVLVVEHSRGGIEVPRDVLVPAERAELVELEPVLGVELGVRLARAGLVVEPEHDREAPALPDRVGARESNHISGGEVVPGEEIDQVGRIAPRARHDVVRVLLARCQAVNPA